MENNESQFRPEIRSIKETIVKDYLPYWPYFIMSALLAQFAAFVYLRYQVPQYQVDATLMIKKEKEGINSMVEKLVGENRGTSMANNISDKLYVLQSNKIKMLAAKMANLQVKIESHGKVSRLESYQKLPFDVVLSEPDSVVDFKAEFTCDPQHRGLVIGGKLYPLNQPIQLGGNALMLRCADPKACGDPKAKYTLFIFSLSTAANVNASGFTAKMADKGSSIVNLSLTTNIPQKGVKMLDAIMQAYKDVSMDEKLMQAKNTIQFVDERLRVLSGDLDSVEGSIEAFKRSNGIADISAESELFMENVAESDKMLAQLDLQLTLLGELERYVIGRGKNPGMVPSLIGLPDGGYTSSLLSKLYEAELKLQETKARNGEKSDLVMAAKQEIQTMKESLFESIQNVRKNLQSLRREYNAKAGKYSELMRDIPSKERKLLNITRQQVVKNGLYTYLLEKREEAAIQYSATLGDVQVLQPAVSNPRPVSPNVSRTYGLALFFGLSLVALVLFLRQWFNNTLQYRSEIERLTPIPVLDEIVQVDADSPLVMKDGNRTLIAEQFRSLRTNLGYYTTEIPQKIKILVSSSIPGEGKSFISTNLAITYSLTGKTTVLIESDLRKPNVSEHFKVSRRIGLSNYLSGSVDIDGILQETGIPNLYIIPSGPLPPNPVELIIGTSKYKDLVDTLIARFDRVVIDCPPIGLVTDAQLLSHMVDLSLFVCRQNHTPKDAFANLLNPLNALGKFGRMALVFNGLTTGANGLGNGNGYGYGYGYPYLYYGEETTEKRHWFLKFMGTLLMPITGPMKMVKRWLWK